MERRFAGLMGFGTARHDRPGFNQLGDDAASLTPLATVEADVKGILLPAWHRRSEVLPKEKQPRPPLTWRRGRI